MVSKSVWNLPGGPWDRLFAGVWNRFNVAVYENADKTLLTTIFPKSGEVSWIMVRVDKILIIPEGIEKIEARLAEKNIHILKQHLKDDRRAYVILLTPPTTVEFGSKEIGDNVFKKVMMLKEEVEDIKNIAKSAGVEIIDMKDASYKESANIMGNPTILLSLLSISADGEEPPKEKLKELVLGDNGDELFKVDESIFSGYTSIKKGNSEERNYLAQILLEETIIDAAPIPVILDFSKHPLKLGQGNPYPYDYTKYGFEDHSVSFKLDSYDLSKDDCNIRINLNQVGPQFLWKIMGLGKDEVSTRILETMNVMQNAKSIEDIDSIIEEIKKSPGSTENDKLVTAKAQRVLRTIKKNYGDIFSNGSDTRKIIHGWITNNKTAYIYFTELGKKEKLAFAYYILESIQTLKDSGELSEIETKRTEHIYLAVLNMDWLGEGNVQSEIINEIINNHKGALFMNEEELPMKIESRIGYRFHIVGPKRAKLYIGGRGKEFAIRPLLSCPP